MSKTMVTLLLCQVRVPFPLGLFSPVCNLHGRPSLLSNLGPGVKSQVCPRVRTVYFMGAQQMFNE